MSDEPIGGPARPPRGMEWLRRYRAAHLACDHQPHSLAHISTISLVRIRPDGVRIGYCRHCQGHFRAAGIDGEWEGPA